MTNFASSDFATTLDALLVTLANMKIDSGHLMTDDKWDGLFTMVGESMYDAGKDGRWMDVQAMLSYITINFTVESTPISLMSRMREVKANIGR